MDREDIERHKGKYVTIRLKSNSTVIWEGIIKDVRTQAFDIIDKRNEPVTLSNDDVSSIKGKNTKGDTVED